MVAAEKKCEHVSILMLSCAFMTSFDGVDVLLSHVQLYWPAEGKKVLQNVKFNTVY